MKRPKRRKLTPEEEDADIALGMASLARGEILTLDEVYALERKRAERRSFRAGLIAGAFVGWLSAVIGWAVWS